MDEDLKIVVSTELEADEEASAKRITSQIPSIAEKVNQRSKIKVGIELDETAINKQAQTVSAGINKALLNHKVGVHINLDDSSVERLQSSLNELKVNPNIVKDVTREVDNMGIHIKQIASQWEKATDGEEKILSLTIQGEDQYKRLVTQVLRYNTETQESEKTLTRIVSDYGRLEQVEAKAAARAKKDNEERLNYLSQQEKIIKSLQNSYTGATGTKPVSGKNLEALEFGYKKISEAIDEQRNKVGALSQADKEFFSNTTAILREMTKQYQNAEYVGTQLRDTNVKTVNAKLTNELAEYEKTLQTSGRLTSDFKIRIDELRESLSTAFDRESLTNYLNELDKFKSEVKAAGAENKLAEQISAINAEMDVMPSKIAALESQFGMLDAPTKSLDDNLRTARELMEAVNLEADDNRKIETYNKLQRVLRLCNTEMTALSKSSANDIRATQLAEGIEKARADLETVGRTWSQLKNDPGLNTQFDELRNRLADITSRGDLTKWRAEFSAFKSDVKAAGANVQSLGDIFRTNLGKVLQWVSATTLLFRAVNLIKTGISTVVDLDTALVDLRKTTNATSAEYRAFYDEANGTAKRLNATTEAVIAQTAEWSRLGYSMQNAAKLAENSAIFAAVSPGMDQETATNGLVSIIKAYGIDVEDTIDGIISKVNSVGNAFAVSNNDIVEALTRSSSAMAAANNSFEQTVALATAAIEITRDAEGVGNALKTLSMRIRGYDEETEEYSEDIAVLTGKVADFTKTASNPSGVSLFTDETRRQYRATYDILSDIANIWDEIDDKNQARLLENLFGKRQSQVGAAILSNFKQASDSMNTMANSAGSAEREMEKIMDSLDYRLNALRETWVGVAQNLFEQEDIKIAIDFLQGLSDIIDRLTEHLGLFGTIGVAGAITWLTQLIKTVGKPKLTGFKTVPTYIPMATWNELAA